MQLPRDIMSGTNHPRRDDTGHPDPQVLAPPTASPVEPTISNESRSERTRKRSRRIWIAAGVFAVVAGAVGGYLLLERSSTSNDRDEQALPALPTDEHTGWIGSGRYQIPDEVPPGLYRVGREFSIRDEGDDVDRQSSVTYEGMTLVMISPSAPPGTIEIGGGAWPLKENGPVDPTRFEDGTYVVGFDLEPGTYRVTPVTNGLNIANAGIVDEGGQITRSDYLDSSDSAAGVKSLTIEIESTDFAFYFSGHLERVD